MVGKTALITGVTGQDGSYLADLLLEKGYQVHGLVRSGSRASSAWLEETKATSAKLGRVFQLHTGDIGDWQGLDRLFRELRPDEVYNLAAQSQVGETFKSPIASVEVDGTGVLRLLECIRLNKLETRFYQASSAELFGKVRESPQNETTPFHPCSPYAVAKLYAFWIVKHYREGYGMHAGNGILFNHESPRRGENFVTRKITLSLARIRTGLQETLRLGNIDARRDWGHAADFVEMMWLMLQQPTGDDYVTATGESHTVREFIEAASAFAGFEIVWEGKGLEEVGRDRKSGKVVIEIDPQFYRPSEAAFLLGDPAKAKARLGWEPKVKFVDLVRMMMEADLARISPKT